MSSQTQNSFIVIIPRNVRCYIWMLVKKKKKSGESLSLFLWDKSHKDDTASRLLESTLPQNGGTFSEQEAKQR